VAQIENLFFKLSRQHKNSSQLLNNLVYIILKALQ